MDVAEKAGIYFLWFGAVVAVLLGAGMLLIPSKVSNLNQYLSHWVDTNSMDQAMDKPRATERFFYKYHRLVGTILLVGALLVLKVFLLGSGLKKVSVTASPEIAILLDSAATIFVVGSVVAVIVGFILVGRPSVLRDIESSANRWVSTDGLLRFFNNLHATADTKMFAHRRLTGAFLLLGGLYVATVLGFLLF